jgi:hypothetical protein
VSDDFAEYIRRRQARGPLEGAGAVLLGFGVGLVLPMNIRPIVFGVSCGVVVFLAGMAHFLCKALEEVSRQTREREDQDWDHAVNAGIRNPDAPS